MTTPRTSDLPATWRQRAELFRRHGAAEAAQAVATLAEELDESLRADAGTLLTLADAATECGVSPAHIGRLVRGGKVTNYGRKYAPLVRREDLPKKAAGLPASRGGGMLSDARRQAVRAIVASH
jgi:hypothetical protein